MLDYSEKELVVDKGVSGEVTAASIVPDKEEKIIEEVANEHAKKQAHVQLLVIHTDLDDERSDAAVKHDKVPVHAHQEEVTEGVPLVFKQDRFLLVKVVYRWSVDELINDITLLDILFGFRTHLLNASHKEFVHYFPRNFCLINVEALRYGTFA